MSWSTPDPYYQPEAFDLEIYATCGDGGYTPGGWTFPSDAEVVDFKAGISELRF